MSSLTGYAPDEVDLQLVHLLQINPRISWAAAEPILGLSATAIAARWSRLVHEGLAWTAVYPGVRHDGHLVSIVEVDCKGSRRADIVHTLCLDPRVVSLDEASGRRDLVLTVMVPDLPALGTFVLDDLMRVRGITHVRSGLVTAVHLEGSSWRLDALDPAQQRAATAARPADAQRGSPPQPASYETLIAGLSHDARRSVAQLARGVQTSPTTLQRQLRHVLDTGWLSLRCDVAPQLSGQHIEWSWLSTVAPSDKDAVVTALLTRPELRMCLSVTGESNLIFSVRTRSIQALNTFEQFIAHDLPGLTPTETIVHLRPHKRMGRLLRRDGRATDHVIIPTLLPG